jgi:uncharacterized protein YjeT (DUF2065 family)
MNDFLVGVGLVLVIEGLLWALAPGLAARLLELAATTPEQQLRTGGAVAVAVGVLVVWLVRT